MTIDEFLVSNEVSHEFDRDYVLKVKYNDNIDYIFKTNYGKLDFNKDLKCVGLFNKSNNKLYGASYEFNGTFNKDMYSNFYSGTIEQIRIDLYKNADKFGRINIGNNVHIGTNATIMPGITIGDNCIVACNAVVTHDVPSGSIVGGIPAKLIETLDDYEKKNRDKIFSTKHLSPKEKKNYLIGKKL